MTWSVKFRRNNLSTINTHHTWFDYPSRDKFYARCGVNHIYKRECLRIFGSIVLTSNHGRDRYYIMFGED